MKESKAQGKPKPTKLARDFFDTHYKQVFGPNWPKIRLALLSKPKFAAMVNNFSCKEEIIGDLQKLGCINIKDLYAEGKIFKFLERIFEDLKMLSNQKYLNK